MKENLIRRRSLINDEDNNKERALGDWFAYLSSPCIDEKDSDSEDGVDFGQPDLDLDTQPFNLQNPVALHPRDHGVIL